MGKPYFSIIIPCYNQAHFLTKAIESIRYQGFENWEAIIINDGSTDQTRKIAESLKLGDDRILVISQSNLGLSDARNTGITHAKGQVINFLDADDWLLNDCLQVVFDRFQDSESDILVTGFTYFKETNPIHSHSFSLDGISMARLIKGNIAPPVAFFVKNQVVQSVGNFDTALKSCEDWDYWIRAGNSGFSFFSIPEILVAYRYVPDSMSRNPRQMYEALLIVSDRAQSIATNKSSDLFLSEKSIGNHVPQGKHHFIKCLGVSLFQGKLEESITWYLEETEKYGWQFEKSDWSGLSSNLSFKYFLSPPEIEQVLNITRPIVSKFLKAIGYSERERKNALSLIFAAQLKKRNHLNYGKVIGGLLNKLGLWG